MYEILIERKKRTGKLPDFDPSGSYVHPSSRVRLPFKLNMRGGRKFRARRSRSDSDELAMSAFSGFDSESSAGPTSRRRLRPRASKAGGGRARELPFSPRKTRSIRDYFPPEASEFDSDSDIQEIPAPTRRSTRKRMQLRTDLDDDNYADEVSVADSDEFDDFDDNYSDAPSQSKAIKKKKIQRARRSRPAYGLFRDIADLDEEGDEEDIALRAHRMICEKCHRKPAHLLLEDARKPKKGRRKRKQDSEEEDENDEERFARLGGWVRW